MDSEDEMERALTRAELEQELAENKQMILNAENTKRRLRNHPPYDSTSPYIVERWASMEERFWAKHPEATLFRSIY
jgi:hypothetical protein